MSHAHPIIKELSDLQRVAKVPPRVLATRIWSGAATVRVSRLGDWETGLCTPTVAKLTAWAGALGMLVCVQPRGGEPIKDVGLVAALTQLRKGRGIRQLELSELAGCTQSQLSSWERDARVPGLVVLARWADALDCDLVLVPAAVLAVAA